MMTERPGAPTDDGLLDEALDWVIRLKGGAVTRSDIDALGHWRQQSHAHEEAFKSAVRIYRHAGIAAHEYAEEVKSSDAMSSVRPQSRLLARRAVLAGGMLAAAVYGGLRPPFGLWPSIEEISADYRTGKGERRNVEIASDISLELNTQTSVSLRAATEETRIELISGEAWVATSAILAKPLVMLAGGGMVSASRASFNLRCLDQTVAVACLDGHVTVDYQGRTAQLGPAQQVSFSNVGLGRPTPADMTQVAAWKAGSLIFRDRPLADVAEEINRYRAGRIVVTSAALARRLVSGTFQLDKLDDFVLQVEQLFAARITRLPGGIVLVS